MGINGQRVLFYAKRQPISSPAPKRSSSKGTNQKYDEYADLIADVAALRGSSVKATEVAEAVKAKYPDGIANKDYHEVVTQVFLYIEGER